MILLSIAEKPLFGIRPVKVHPGHSGDQNRQPRAQLFSGSAGGESACTQSERASDGGGRQGTVGEIWVCCVLICGCVGPLVPVTPECSAGRPTGHSPFLPAPG